MMESKLQESQPVVSWQHLDKGQLSCVVFRSVWRPWWDAPWSEAFSWSRGPNAGAEAAPLEQVGNEWLKLSLFWMQQVQRILLYFSEKLWHSWNLSAEIDREREALLAFFVANSQAWEEHMKRNAFLVSHNDKNGVTHLHLCLCSFCVWLKSSD